MYSKALRRCWRQVSITVNIVSTKRLLRIDAQHAMAHNKVMVITGQVVVAGSFNFTKNAEENNAENLLVIRDAALAEKYAANWKAHAEHSEACEGRGGETAPRERAPRRKAA